MSATQQAIRERAASNQRRAADPFASAWVSANAGSGKTRVLIDRVSRLLFAGVDPARILCITYTKAAASEMSGRLFARLGEWSTSSNEDLEKALRELGAEYRPDNLSEARRLFARALESPGGLKIETIHAFCQRILQRFPIEGRVPPDFEVKDEREAQILLKEARAELFAGLKAPELLPLAGSVALLLEEQAQSNFGKIIEEGIKNRTKIEAFLARAGNDAGRFVRAKLGLKPDDTLASIEAECLSDLACAEAALRDYAQTLLRGSKAEQTRAEVFVRYFEADDRSLHLVEYKALFFKKDGDQRANRATKTTSARWDEFEALLNAEHERLSQWRSKRRALDVAIQTEAALDILRYIFAGYERLKIKNGALDYDDLIEKTLRLLQNSANAWVHYKLDGGIDHVLIDEAQDTSPDQWLIVQALTAEFFAQEAHDATRQRTVFAVGDEKQSIYSFQGADPRKFDEMRRVFGAAVTESGRAWVPADLEVSFRSVPQILRAVDAAFDGPEARSALTARANEVRHEAERIGEQGLVELWSGARRETVNLSVHANWTRPVDERPQTAPEIVLANRITKLIRSWLDEGTPIPAKDGGTRTIEAGDVLILVRQRGGQYYEMLRALTAANLPVAGSDRLMLRDAIAFRDLDALGRFCLFPTDDLALAEVLKGPFVGLTDDDLLKIAPQRRGTLWQVLSAAADAPFARAHEWLQEALQLSRILRPFEFYQRVLHHGVGAEAPRRSFIERLGLEAEDAIAEFLSLALSFERVGPATLQGFLAFATEKADSIKRDMEEAQDRIRVMTVHGAKGLEAPVVFLIDTCTVPRAPSGKWLIDNVKEAAPIIRLTKAQRDDISNALADREKARQDQEYLRQLYVAMTRAKDRLYIAGVRPARHGYAGSWHELLDTTLAAVDDIKRIEIDGDIVLRLGAEPTGDARRAAPPFVRTDLPSWIGRVPAPERALLRRTPSALLPPDEESGLPPVFAPAPGARDPFLRGRAIHKLLEMLPEVAVAERAGVARRLFGLATYRALAEQQDEIIDEVLRLFDRSEFARVFGPDSRAEVAISGALTTASGRPLLISGQIDRLLVTDNEILIVDFKTNRPPPKTAAEVPRAYTSQMAAYAHLLDAALPGREIKAALLYTVVPRLIALDLAEIDVTQITAEGSKR